MRSLNDHLATATLMTGQTARPVPKRHYLRCWESNLAVVMARRQFAAEPHTGTQAGKAGGAPLNVQPLAPGQAVTLRAGALSVLRIAHGRVWVTVTGVGPYSRVIAGDHFLSRGDSLTLLPGQELVMEPFGRGETTSAQFTWGPPGAAATLTLLTVVPNWRGEVMQPLLDLRHAGGLAARALGRLVLGVGHAVVAEVERVGNYIAMIFVAGGANKSGAGRRFDALPGDSGTPCKSC